MKQFTDEALARAVKDLTYSLAKDTYIELNEVHIIKNTDNYVAFEVTSMYDVPFEFTQDIYEAFVALFETENVDVYEDITNGGCETCDYWSQYGYAIRVWA